MNSALCWVVAVGVLFLLPNFVCATLQPLLGSAGHCRRLPLSISFAGPPAMLVVPKLSFPPLAVLLLVEVSVSEASVHIVELSVVHYSLALMEGCLQNFKLHI